MEKDVKVKWSVFYRLDKDKVITNVPEKAGVYILWLQVKKKKWICRYVSESNNLKKTLLGHLTPDEQNRCIKKHVKKRHVLGLEYTEVENQERRKGIVKYIYDRFRPECNPEDPGGDPINIDLPHDIELWRKQAKIELKEMAESK